MDAEKGFQVSDILYGVIVPCIVALLIIVFPAYLGPALDFTLRSIFVEGLAEAILIVAVPILLGLLWNQWAGGASGFLLGSIYALYRCTTYIYYGLSSYLNDIAILGYIVSGMLTGYVAGALNKGSTNFRKMLTCGIVSGIIGGVFLFWTQLMSPLKMVSLEGWWIVFLPRIIYGIIMPIIAKVFTWYNVTPRR